MLFVRIQTLFQKLLSEKEEDDGKKSESQKISNSFLLVINDDKFIRFDDRVRARAKIMKYEKELGDEYERRYEQVYPSLF